MSIELLKAKVKKFTDTESVAMKEWLRAVLTGRLVIAEKLYDTGVLLEHWQSVLDPDPDKHSDEEKAEEARLQRDFDAALKEFRGDAGEPPVPQDRGEILRREAQ